MSHNFILVFKSSKAFFTLTAESQDL